jgi:tRNA A-37 threonylcarbamoyl transferase component Bud32
MAETRRCPQCDHEIPVDAPADLCPECLLRQAQAGKSALDGAGATSQPRRFVPPAPKELEAKLVGLEILDFVGAGGMGAVYKARQVRLDRLVAVKILPAELGRDSAFEERFAREARSLAMLNHPNIVAIYDFGQTDGLYYLIMEFVEGANVRDLIKNGGLSPQEALAIVPQICEALQFAHDEGIIHRDIKPENLLVDTRGRVKIADFGLAKIVGRSPDGLPLTATQQVLGTLHYMAPEQMEGSDAVDHRADIYSLGVVFYEMLTGEVPIGKFAAPSKKVQVDVRLDEVVMRALEREPIRRYQQASEVKTAVDAISGREARGVPQPARNGTAADDADNRAFPADPARTIKAVFWLLACLNGFVVLITAIFSSPQREATQLGFFEIRTITPGLFGTICDHINCSRVIWTMCATLTLSAGVYWLVCAWFGIDAYPGRQRELNESRGRWKRRFATGRGLAILFCALGLVVAIVPWAVVEKKGMVAPTPAPGKLMSGASQAERTERTPFESLFVQESRWIFGGTDSDVGFFILLVLFFCSLLLAASSASVLLPRVSPSIVMTSGAIVALLSALYVGLNIGGPFAVEPISDAPPWFPWINANLMVPAGGFVLCPVEGMIVKVHPTVSPLLEFLIGLALCLSARKMRCARDPGRVPTSLSLQPNVAGA